MQRDRLSALEDLVRSCSNGGTLRVSYPDEVKEMLDKQNDVCGWSYCLEVSPTELGRILDRVRIVRNLDSFDADNLSTAVAKAAHRPRVRLRSPFSYRLDKSNAKLHHLASCPGARSEPASLSQPVVAYGLQPDIEARVPLRCAEPDASDSRSKTGNHMMQVTVEPFSFRRYLRC